MNGFGWSAPVEIGGVFTPQIDPADAFAPLSAPIGQGDTEPAYGTPAWWFARLLAQIASRQAAVTMYEAYYLGFHRMTFATAQWKAAFGGLAASYADNWCQLVVDAACERLIIEGFRFGGVEQPADLEAWRIWQANQMEGESSLAHTQATTSGSAYIVGAPPAEAGGDPRLTVVHPLCAAIELDPRNKRRTLAGVHLWNEPDGLTRAVLYLPDLIVWWQLATSNPEASWQPVEGDGPDRSGLNPLGVVPIVQIVNRPLLWSRQGLSDLEAVRRNQDAINKVTADALVASEYAAYPQRFASGLEVPTDPTTGQPLSSAQFQAALSRLWVSEDPDTKWGSFQAADLTNYTRLIEMLIQHIAAQTRTPPHYLLGQSGAFPSGESLKATETGLVARVREKQRSFGEAWIAAMRLAFQIARDDRAAAPAAEVIWSDPESVSEAERVDALTKMATLGVPKPVLWERWGATPQEVARWTALAAGERLPGLPTTPPAGTPPALTPGGGVTPPPAGVMPAPTP